MNPAERPDSRADRLLELDLDLASVRAAVARCLTDLGWDRLLAKARDGEQSLLEHSLAVFDVLSTCLPFFAAESYPPLARQEVLGMLIAAAAHDAGKASPPFQAYLRGETHEFAEHVDPEQIRRTIESLAGAIGEDVGVHLEDAISSSVLHDARSRRDRGELVEWERTHASPRWRKLADVVNHADSLASLVDVMDAEGFLRKNAVVVGGATVASYRVRVRGVSTTFLHEVALGAFSAAGWSPIVHFADGTVLAGRGTVIPTHSEIAARLRARLEEVFDARASHLCQLAVGNPLNNFLPAPEYVRRDRLAELWDVAASRAKRKTELKAADRETYEAQWRKTFGERSSPGARDLEALRDIGPEACAFKLMKNLLTNVFDVKDRPGVREHAKRIYESVFGESSFDALLRQGTYQPVNDYKLCVRPWHLLPGRVVDEPAVDRVGELDPERRKDSLKRLLVNTIEKVMAADDRPLPNERLLEEWSARLMADFVLQEDPSAKRLVEQSLDGYAALQDRSRKKGPAQCVHCAGLIVADEAEKTSDALGNATSFTNRRPAFELRGPQWPAVCRGCVVDLKLGQLLLGGAVKTVVALVPRRSLGPGGAAEIVERVRSLRSVIERQLAPDTADPSKYIALTFPVDLLRVSVAAQSLSECVIRQVSPGTNKKRQKKLAEVLRDLIDETGLEDLNASFGTTFASMMELAAALVEGIAPAAIRGDNDVTRALDTLSGTAADFAAPTPNLVTVSLGSELGSRDDSHADRAFYAFGLAALFAREFGMACFVGPLNELRTALACRAGRSVFVPANASARRILGGEWLGFEDALRWLRAIQAAIALRSDAKARSVLEVLRYPSAGFVVRRIEQHGDKKIGPRNWPHIEALKEVLG